MSIKRFIARTLLATIPIWIVAGIYIFADPFNILRFKEERTLSHFAAGRNMGFVSINTFLKYNDRRHYNSFIFGSSMSQNYRVDDWLKHLPQGASPIHMDATMETVDGIVDKLKFLDKHEARIDNALIIIEEEMLRRTPLDNEIIHIRPPEITDEVSWFKFHTLFFNAYKNPLVIGYCIAPKSFHHQMEQEGIIMVAPTIRINKYNEFRYAIADSIIAKAPNAFFTPEKIKEVTTNKEALPTVHGTVMTPHLIEQLKSLRALLDKNKTNYIVIIPPRYQRRWLSPADLNVLRSILGESRVKDYSRDTMLRDNPGAYYDKHGHLISKYCGQLLDRAYGCDTATFINSPYSFGN